jgi:transcriptional regulator with XRE-family HTH domain
MTQPPTPPKRPRPKRTPEPFPVTEFFGIALKQRRLALGMTQATLAQGAKISQTKITAIEAGRVNVHLRTADALARSIGVPLRELLPPD